MRRRLLLPVLALALHGCATAPSPAPAPRAAPATKTDSALATELAWLQQWFSGTPVVITQQDDGPVSVDVPREFCFDAGRSKVNPPLAAVLDKVAQSLRRTGARLTRLAAPGDAAATSPLALQRAEALRKHLLSKGVPAAQLGKPSATTVAAVQLRMERTPP
jgi:outer membrane protein OmpA-like peptidoglycan-associated protein